MSDNVEIGSPCTRDVNGPGETDRQRRLAATIG